MTHFGTPLLELERWVLAHSDRLHAISEAIRVDVEADQRRPPSTTTRRGRADRSVDRFATSPPVRGPTAEPCTILFVGRFEKRKGVDLLLAALPRLLTEVPSARVVMVGRNDLRR